MTTPTACKLPWIHISRVLQTHNGS
jgi:hypothetical protein